MNGFAVANHRPMPVAMMKAPSVTPTARKNLVCSCGISSGWRALASSIFIDARPMPMHEPSAGTAIFSGIVLAIGRAAEDTAVIMLTGVVANAGIPRALSDKFEALPFSIFYLTAEHRDDFELQKAFGSALVLLALTGTLFCLSYALKKRLERRWRRGE